MRSEGIAAGAFFALLTLGGLVACAAPVPAPTGKADSTGQSQPAPCGVRDGVHYGWVALAFDVVTTRPVNLRVLASCPVGHFEASALEAVAKWRYPESPLGGVQVRLMFTPDESGVEETSNAPLPGTEAGL